MLRSRLDRAFVRYARTGDPGALARVFDGCAAELYRIGFHLVGDRHLAEDLVQQPSSSRSSTRSPRSRRSRGPLAAGALSPGAAAPPRARTDAAAGGRSNGLYEGQSGQNQPFRAPAGRYTLDVVDARGVRATTAFELRANDPAPFVELPLPKRDVK